MATKKQESVTAVVLCDCIFGNVGEVVTLTPGEAETGRAIGVLDTHPAAVAYAESLKG